MWIQFLTIHFLYVGTRTNLFIEYTFNLSGGNLQAFTVEIFEIYFQAYSSQNEVQIFSSDGAVSQPVT